MHRKILQLFQVLLFDCVWIVQKESMLSLLENRELDSEIRINAYLATMRCADEQTLGRIQIVLESEVITQVGSFIWTHITNLLMDVIRR